MEGSGWAAYILHLKSQTVCRDPLIPSLVAVPSAQRIMLLAPNSSLP
jgi:hypothetical protein